MCIAEVVDLFGDKMMRSPQSLDRDEMRKIAETILEVDRHGYDWETAILSQSPNKATQDAGVRFHRSASLRIVRRGLASCILLMIIGIFFFVLINKGAGLAFLLSGPLALLTFAYGHGLRTDDYLVSPRYSILGIVVLSGLVITSLIAGMEAFFRVP